MKSYKIKLVFSDKIFLGTAIMIAIGLLWLKFLKEIHIGFALIPSAIIYFIIFKYF
jgi:hypothetical protein